MKKIKAFLLFAVLIFTACVFSSCVFLTVKQASKSDMGLSDLQASDNYGVTFYDETGKEITLSKKPEQVAVLFSSFAEMTLLSGGSVDITVGESVERGFVPEGTPLVDIGAGKTVNNELLLAYKPDFIIGSSDIAAHVEAAKALEASGIPFALFRVESFEDYERVMKLLCEIFENQQAYEENVARLRQEIEDVLTNIDMSSESKKILFVRCASNAKATKAKTKKENFVCQMLDEMNTVNIAEAAPILLDGLSVEYILVNQPDFIFFSPMGDEEAATEYVNSMLLRPEWQTLDAVKNSKYAFLPKELFHFKPNNRWSQAYKYLSELLYGEEN